MNAPSVILGAVALCALLGAGCGKKGPPLAPIVRIPAAVERVSARRVGDDVYVTFTVPSQNIDASMPADVRRVEVYAATATAPPPRTRFLEIAELIDTVSVAPPPSAEADSINRATDAEVDAAVQGAMITVRDVLSPNDLVARNLPAQASATKRPVALPVPETRGELRRFYLTVAFSARGRPGPPGAIAEFPLTPLPEAPTDLEVSYTSEMMLVAWQPSGGLLGFLLNRELPPEPAPFDEFVPPRTPASAKPIPPVSPPSASPVLPAPSTLPPPTPQSSGSTPLAPASGLFGPTRYNVYRELESDPLLLPTPSDRLAAPLLAVPPTPLNPTPLDTLTFTDELEFERERCYVVRAVRGTGANLVEGQGSERHCVRPVDIFPPEAPVGLSAVAAAGAISLIWEANTGLDIAGYLILRGGSADATLLPLTNVPSAETQFTDRTVTPGDRYVYAVVAVDNRVPLPNVSAESMRVEETAR